MLLIHLPNSHNNSIMADSYVFPLFSTAVCFIGSFGYVVEGANFLADVKEDDVIVSAKVIDGVDRVVQPKV